MNSRNIKTLALGFLFLASTASFAQQKMPNIVFILTDDLGWHDLSCYGNKNNETPVIDKLAENGVRFTQAYAGAPVCSPTRASILTGKYPARLHFTNYQGGNNVDRNLPVLPAKWKQNLDGAEITIAELLHDKGYATGMVGKWHVGGAETQAPWSQGFDYTRMIGKNSLDYYNYSIYIDSYKKEFTDHGTEYLTDKLTGYGVDFIKENSETPFFLYLAYSAPHVFIVPRGDKLQKYFWKYGKSEEKFNPYYAAMVESIDDGVGRIVQTLEEEGLLENTIIVLTSDNGGLGLDELGPTPTSNAPLRKWKGHIYEGGIRVPTIVSWPAGIKEGRVSDRYFSSIDYLPTLCELANIDQLPENIDGKSIVPLLLDPEIRSEQDRAIFWHYPHISNQLGQLSGAVRIGDFKLVEHFDTGKLELYNLAEDISESNDLSGKMKEKTSQMYQQLRDWRADVDANMPIPNPELKK